MQDRTLPIVDIDLLREGDRTVFHEVWETDAYGIALLDAPGTIVDIGAHVGIFAITCALKWPGSCVTAVEPHPENYRRLVDHIERNGVANVNAVEGAMGYSHGDTLWVPDPSTTVATGGSCLGSATAPCEKVLPYDHVSPLPVTVRVYSLEEIAPEPPDVLKLDCEGGEIDLFENGLGDYIAKIPVILGEYHDARGGDHFRSLLDMRRPGCVNRVRGVGDGKLGMFVSLGEGWWA